MTTDHSVKFSETIWAFESAQYDFEEALEKVGVEFERLGWDHYDNSVELYGVGDDVRPVPAQRVVRAAGFSTAYVNHENGWETHYSWSGEEFVPCRGWRRHMVHDVEPGPSGVIGFSKMRISYWPESWRASQLKEDLRSGKIEIVPDPLEIEEGVR